MITQYVKKLFLSTAFGAALFTGTAQSVSLSLQEAVSLANKNNRTLKIADLDISVAKEQVRVAKSLSLPSASLGGQYTHYFVLPAFFGFGETNGNNSKIPYSRIGGRDQFAATVAASYPIYNPSARPSIRAAQLQERAGRTDYKARTIDVTASVKQTYIGILVLNERLKLQHESLQRNQKALADARSLLAQGRGLRVDTLRAYTSVKNLQPDILKLTYAIDVGKLQLVTLIGLDSLSDLSLTDSLSISSSELIPEETTLYEDAKTRRPDLQVLNLQQQISEQQTALAKSLRLPVVSLLGQYQVQSQARRFDFANAYWPSATFAGASVTVPLFTGYSTQAKIKQAKLAQEQSAVRITDAEKQLKTEVRQVVANLHETFERMNTQSQVKETAKLSYDIIQYRYSKGVASRLELTDAELALTTAQLNYLESVFDYLSARIELDRTRGGE